MNSARPFPPWLLVLGWLAGAPAGWAQPTPPSPPRPPVAAPPAAGQPARPTPTVAAPSRPAAQRANPPPALPLPEPPVPPAQIPRVPGAPPAQPEAPADPLKGSSTGQPIPRFASLRTEPVNFRVGPGERYPIDWTYTRRDLPVRIEREFDVWRLVRDAEDTRGWVHVRNLAPRRTFVVTGGERTLRRSPADDAAAVAKLQAGVIGTIRSCREGADWCQLQTSDHRGWLKRTEFYGTLPGEKVN